MFWETLKLLVYSISGIWVLCYLLSMMMTTGGVASHAETETRIDPIEVFDEELSLQ
ncbi:hypothetical protein AciX9_1998 [Granulicella tundricola MP5ACTX9]|uniref:Uncharacterized protein n=2 Tax=Granulicella TaxID=940557 RepID=E8X189_GRATM|nr:hypothetical protein AciX9_1998 [Granulicella tundricola MP5ACTX9]